MSRGHDRERAIRALRASEGWLSFRAPASLGVADVICLKAGERPQLIEVKSTLTPYAHFSPRDRAELLAAAIQAGADPWLAWWPSRGKLHWIPSDEWPTNGQTTNGGEHVPDPDALHR